MPLFWQKMIWGASKCDSTSREDLLNATCNMDVEAGHSNIVAKGFFGFVGLFAKLGDALFGDGTKH